MQSNILNTKILVYISVMFFLISSCKKGKDLENQITIKITSIDSKTRQRRVNMFDTIEVRKEGIGFLMKSYKLVGEYVTDSTASVTIKIDRDEGYLFFLRKRGFYGEECFADPYTKEKLKDGQEVNLKVRSYENY